MRRRLKVFFTSLILVLGLLLIVAGAYLFWYFNRPLPEPVTEQAIFEGITYTREIRREPRPMILHIVTVDLDAPGIGFLVTPPDELDGYIYAARTTSQFLSEFGLQLAVNGDYFDPWYADGLFGYYPYVGDGVNVRGLTIAQGEVLTQGYAPPDDYGTMFVSTTHRVSFFDPINDVESAISGMSLLDDGENVASWGDPDYLEYPHPRTAVAVDTSGEHLIIVIIDGRQPNYSEGATMPELADILLEHGAYDALNLDGGGSTTLVIEGADGQPMQLGSAIHTRVPARERPVANHLGIYANSIRG